MNKYMFLFRGGEPSAELSPKEMQANMQKWGGWMQGLSKTGNFVAGEPLDVQGKVVRGTSKTVTDGPFAEAKDLVGGYLIVSAESLEHAVELSKGCPIFEANGLVEVRPVRTLQM